MKRIVMFILLTSAFALLLSTVAFAGAKIDASGVAKGIVTVTLTDNAGKTIKAQVEKGTEKYVYTLKTSPVNLPLQMGAGEYKITILENVGGDKYKPVAAETVKAAAIDEKELYKQSIPMVDWGVSKTAVPALKTAATGKATDNDKAVAVYDYVVRNVSYDLDKAATVKGDYVPVVDNVFAAKKGICYDYSALVASGLRSQGVPTKLVMGYVPEISTYHAWNEVFINGAWIAVDSTYDAQVVKAGQTYTMKKDKAKTKVVKTY